MTVECRACHPPWEAGKGSRNLAPHLEGVWPRCPWGFGPPASRLRGAVSCCFKPPVGCSVSAATGKNTVLAMQQVGPRRRPTSRFSLEAPWGVRYDSYTAGRSRASWLHPLALPAKWWRARFAGPETPLYSWSRLAKAKANGFLVTMTLRLV